MDDNTTAKKITTVESPAVPIHGDWEQERSFGQQASSGPQRQYELCPPTGHGSHTQSSSLMPHTRSVIPACIGGVRGKDS